MAGVGPNMAPVDKFKEHEISRTELYTGSDPYS